MTQQHIYVDSSESIWKAATGLQAGRNNKFCNVCCRARVGTKWITLFHVLHHVLTEPLITLFYVFKLEQNKGALLIFRRMPLCFHICEYVIIYVRQWHFHKNALPFWAKKLQWKIFICKFVSVITVTASACYVYGQKKEQHVYMASVIKQQSMNLLQLKPHDTEILQKNMSN